MTEVIEQTENKKGYKKTKLGWIPEDWEVKKLGDFGNFKNGISKGGENFGFGTPIIGLNDVFGKFYIKENNLNFLVNASKQELIDFNLNKGDVLFVRSSVKPEGVGLPCVIESNLEKTTFSGFLIRFRDTKGILNDKYKRYCFLLEYFRHRLLSKSTISANTNINQPSLASLNMIVPSLKEQEKIAEILSAWDDGIEALEKLIEQKEIFHKALMKNLLIGKIRLSGYNSKWTHSKFNSIFERITRKNEELNSNILTISAQNGLISQKDFYNKRIASVDTSKYILLKNGEFAYNKSYSNGYPLGAIKRFDLYEKGVVSSLYICFKLNNSDNCLDFWKYYFEAGMLNREIKMIAQEGARNHGLLNMATEDFFNMLLFYPKYSKEQHKIAEILNKSDKEIQLLNSKLEKLKEQKKGLMQKLLTGQIRVKI